jgi:hypothetical protein
VPRCSDFPDLIKGLASHANTDVCEDRLDLQWKKIRLWKTITIRICFIYQVIRIT